MVLPCREYRYDGEYHSFLQDLYLKAVDLPKILAVAEIALLAVLIRALCTLGASRMGYLSSKAVKKTLRELICQKLLRLGTSYNEQVSTSEAVQVTGEGVDQLEIYFGAYLPQLFTVCLRR